MICSSVPQKIIQSSRHLLIVYAHIEIPLIETSTYCVCSYRSLTFFKSLETCILHCPHLALSLPFESIGSSALIVPVLPCHRLAIIGLFFVTGLPAGSRASQPLPTAFMPLLCSAFPSHCSVMAEPSSFWSHGSGCVRIARASFLMAFQPCRLPIVALPPFEYGGMHRYLLFRILYGRVAEAAALLYGFALSCE